jgi:M6 family metalloprotease-like protein
MRPLKRSLAVSSLWCLLSRCGAIDAPSPTTVLSMLLDAARPTFRMGGMQDRSPESPDERLVFLEGSPCCHRMVDAEGYPVEQGEDGEWYYVEPDPADGARRALHELAVGLADPRALFGAVSAHRRRLSDAPCMPVGEGCLAEGELAEPQEEVTELGPSSPSPQLSAESSGQMSIKRNLVLLIRWKDHGSRVLPSRARFDGLSNSESTDAADYPTGSVRQYYMSQSNGHLDFSSAVADWCTAPYTELEVAPGNSGLGFVGGDSKLHRSILFCLDQFAASNDMSEFDMDRDGHIDGFTIVHSGYAAEWGGSDALGTTYQNRIWSHKWSLIQSRTFNGVYIRNYNINPGLWGTSGTGIGRIGVICHELGHFFGLPDLYDGTSPVHATFGSFGVMSNSWGVDGSQRYPPSFSPWSKALMGWAVVSDIGASGTKTLLPYQSSGQVYKVTSGFPSNEYLLIEARSNDPGIALYDSLLPSGIYVWHIDMNTSNNWNNNGGYPGDGGQWPSKHDRVRLIQADNLWHNERNTWWAYDANDAYKNVNQVLSDTSLPALLSYQQLYKSAADCMTTGNTLTGFSFSNTGASTFQYTRSESIPCSGTLRPTERPTPRPTPLPTPLPTTREPSTPPPTTPTPTTSPVDGGTEAPTTEAPTTKAPTTKAPTTEAPTTKAPTTKAPTTKAPTRAPTTQAPTTLAPTHPPGATPRPTTKKQKKAAAYCMASQRSNSASACADKLGSKICSFNYEVAPGRLVDKALPANECAPSSFFQAYAVINAAAYRRCVAPSIVNSKVACLGTRGCYWNEGEEPSSPLVSGFPVQCLPYWTTHSDWTPPVKPG